MRKSVLTIPEIFLIGATRAALGAGLALLLGEKLDRKERRGLDAVSNRGCDNSAFGFGSAG